MSVDFEKLSTQRGEAILDLHSSIAELKSDLHTMKYELERESDRFARLLEKVLDKVQTYEGKHDGETLCNELALLLNDTVRYWYGRNESQMELREKIRNMDENATRA